jgi:hypothetical protein
VCPTVVQQEDVQAVRGRVRKGIDEQLAHVRIQRGERQEEVRARGRLDGALDVEPFEAMRQRSHGLHATGRQAPTADGQEAEAAVVLAEDPARASVRRGAQRLESGRTGGLACRKGRRGFGV